MVASGRARRIAYARPAGRQSDRRCGNQPTRRTRWPGWRLTKDADFVNSYLLRAQPPRLLVISTGNITNGALEALFAAHLATIVTAFQTGEYIEMTRTNLIVHA